MMRMFSGMGLNGEGAGEGFMPMMQGMMKTLLSKEVLYPSLKEINDKVKYLNPYLTNGLSHHYHLGESTFIYRGSISDFEFLFHFFDEICLSKQNSPRWDTAHFAASHLGLFCLLRQISCLPVSHKKDARLI